VGNVVRGRTRDGGAAVTDLAVMALQMAGCIVVAAPVSFGAMWAVFWWADRRGH